MSAGDPPSVGDERLVSQGPRGVGRRLLHNELAWRVRNVRQLDRAIRGMLFPRDLRRINDVLATTSLADRYSVWGGMLLGWAREGRLLAHDMMDADFLVLEEDAVLIEEAALILEQAGYRRLHRYTNNAGQVTEYAFARHEARFDFFLLFPDAGMSSRRFFVYASGPDGLMELEGRLTVEPLEHFDFLGRRWLKPKDHEALLTTIYGDWRTPDPNWSALDDGSIFARRRWNSADHSWTEG
jgi:hypothetical protein